MFRQVMVKTPENSQSQVTIDKSQKLGQGQFGEVYKGVFDSTGEEAAIKIINFQNSDEMQACHDELDIMEKLSKPHAVNIVRLYGYASNSSSYTIAMTYAGNGSLHDWLHGKKQPYFDLQQQMKIMRGVACGLSYIHDLNVLHCDLKPDNVLLDDNMEPKVCDFGLSKRSDTDDLYDISGSPLFMAPEILLAKYESIPHPHSDKSDIYSFSLLCWCVVTQSVIPFKYIDCTGDSAYLVNEVVYYGKREVVPSEPSCPANVAAFIKLGWNQCPLYRPSAKQAVEMLGDTDVNIVANTPAVASCIPTQPSFKKINVARSPVNASQSGSVSCFAGFFSWLNFDVPNVNHETKTRIHTRFIL